MNFLKSGWKSVVGDQSPAEEPTVNETIDKLLDRVKTSTLLEDRRDACRALKSLAKTYRTEVGAMGLEILINVLEVDRSDNETLSYALDSLCCIISGPNEDPADYTGIKSPEETTEDLGIQFTEIFAKRKENIAILLDILEEWDFKVRWPCLRLLMGMLKHKHRDIQDCILSIPGGVSKLMDLLSDSREIIRNDSILLLVHLTRGNANIQKILAFENVFDKIFQIMSEEGYFEGGVVVEDCLIVIQNLLKNNTSNQNLFREGSFIQKLMPFLDMAIIEMDWKPQKVSNILFLYQVIRTLVSPTNPSQTTIASQKVMANCNLLSRLCQLFIASGVPAEVLTETINATSEAIRGNKANQEYFSNVQAPTDPPKPIIVVLLMSMVNEKQALDLRCAILYCFQCYLYKNELGQAQVVETLLPNSTEVSDVTAGQLLCGGLFSNDSLTNWLSALALSHALVDNKVQKEQLIRVQLATDSNTAPSSLMQQCCKMLQQQGRIQQRIGLLILLSTWLSNCPQAVSQFVGMPTNVPYLTSQVSIVEGDDQEVLIQGICAFLLGICLINNDNSVPSFTRTDILDLIINRAGLETFIDKLSAVSKHSSYSKATQKPQLKFKKADDLIFDFEFCKLLKALEHEIIHAAQAGHMSNGPGESMSAEQEMALIPYKNMIRDMDQELQRLRGENYNLHVNYNQMYAANQELLSQNQQLRDQNALLKAQKAVGESSPLAFAEEGNAPELIDDFRQHNENLQRQLDEANQAIANLKYTVQCYESQAVSHVVNTTGALTVNGDSGVYNGTAASAPAAIVSTNNDDQSQRLAQLEAELNAIKAERAKSSGEMETLRKEQEDLLMLLTDQDGKIRDYKKRLKELGVKVDEDNDDE